MTGQIMGKNVMTVTMPQRFRSNRRIWRLVSGNNSLASPSLHTPESTDTVPADGVPNRWNSALWPKAGEACIWIGGEMDFS